MKHGEYQGYVTWDCGSKSYEGDEVYGSDFESMIDIKYKSNDTIGIKESAEFLKYPMKTDKPSMSDEELGLSMKDMYEDDWKEGHWRRIPEIEHIKVCHTIHHMFNHQDLPIVDILHICNFRTEIVRICQMIHFTNHKNSKFGTTFGTRKLFSKKYHKRE